VRVLVAPDAFGGTLSAAQAAEAIATGWSTARPDDRVVVMPLSDGGEGLLDVVATPADTWFGLEVCGPLGRPVEAQMLLTADGGAIVETARACGLALIDADGPVRPDPMVTTSYGVGEMIEAALSLGVRRLVVGLGGSATVDGGAGALTGLGMRLRVADGSGLRVGGADLARIARIEMGWAHVPDGLDIAFLADVTTPLTDCARLFGPQKGAGPDDVARLTASLEVLADVVARDLPGAPDRHAPGTGAAGGLGFGLAAALGGRVLPGAAWVAERVGLAAALAEADVVITGEGRLDATTREGKVVDHVLDAALSARVVPLAVVGAALVDDGRIVDMEAAAPGGAGADPAAEVAAAAARLAERHGGDGSRA